MVSIHDDETNAFIHSLGIGWTGGYRLVDGQNIWGWTDGSPWDYSNWSPGNPDDGDGGREDSVEMRGNGQWNDKEHYKRMPFVCQKPKATTSKLQF